MTTTALQTYLQRHFIRQAEFIAAAACSSAMFSALVEHRAIPGPIYRTRGAWVSSAIDGLAPADLPGTTEWFSPAAIWWARRATALCGNDPATAKAAADRLFEDFQRQLVEAIETLSVARHGFPDLFVDGGVDPEKCNAAARNEWASWIDGGYGVCLKRMSGRNLVIKESESRHVQNLTERGTKPSLSLAEKLELLDALENLDSVMLPFAPHQRPYGTPGKWVDAIVAKYGLGFIPFVVSEWKEDDPERLCA